MSVLRDTRRVLVFGATGTAGAAAARALVDAGHDVTCVVRAGEQDVAGATMITADLSAPEDVMAGAGFDAVVSCIASRSGVPGDAWAVDHDANIRILEAAHHAGVDHFILLSAICVQRPKLAFQHAKLAFEARLIASGLSYSIVRPTAFFKSLTGQIERLRAGKPYLVFGDGTLTACKPISDDDLGRYIASCLTDPARRNRILPIGGPGPAITPRDQAEYLCAAFGQPLRLRSVPLGLLDAIGGGLRLFGRVSPRLATKAELARIGRYYASESMLLWDADTGRYDADATPEFGSETLFAHCDRIIAGQEQQTRGDHSVF